MSQQNVDIVRRFYTRYRGEYERYRRDARDGRVTYKPVQARIRLSLATIPLFRNPHPSRRVCATPMTQPVKLRTLAISLVAVTLLLVLFRLSGVSVPMAGLLLAGIVGYILGTRTGVHVPAWSLFAVSVAGGVGLVAGLSQYSDDDACCSSALVVLISIALGLFLGLAFMAGLAIGGSSHRNTNNQ